MTALVVLVVGLALVWMLDDRLTLAVNELARLSRKEASSTVENPEIDAGEVRQMTSVQWHEISWDFKVTRYGQRYVIGFDKAGAPALFPVLIVPEPKAAGEGSDGSE